MSPVRGSRILASLVASGRWKYSLVTTGPRTTNSPISPGGSESESLHSAIGSSLIGITQTCIPATGRPTHRGDSAAPERAYHRRRTEQVRHAELPDLGHCLLRVDPRRPGRVHVGDHAGHAESGAEQCEERESAKIDFAGFDAVGGFED